MGAGDTIRGAVKAAGEVAEQLAAPPPPSAAGAPASEPPSQQEPALARGPLPPKPGQADPGLVSPTGVRVGGQGPARAQQGDYLTSSQGLRLTDTDHSLKAGSRGPTLLQDHHLREKITHFDHERIPERVVHARGAGAHGVFTGNGSASAVCRADFLARDRRTPVFVRFSTVLGSRGSADTVRDTRGFATKFYTSEGTFDLVANNMPVFFIQDGIKFPDIIHAAKPRPDCEIPQAQSAHDTFWDFVSLHTAAQHHVMWNMSDRGIPRSYRMMEGFGVHTFRLQNHDGGTILVKFHWRPRLGVHSLTWEEAQLAAGGDPDFHRRDLYDALDSGALPEWDLGIQVFPDTPEQAFAGIDLLDPTKLVPEELAQVQVIGTLRLTSQPSNFFAETEQVAFHVGNLVPGIDLTDDPLLQARLFSYLDTQLTRLGGPNFPQLPINRPHSPVNDMLRDGYHQQAVHTGVAPYRPNSLDGGNPFPADAAGGGYAEHPARVAPSPKVRQSPTSFDDHYSQARLFWRSMSATEQEHIISAYTFELYRCFEQAIKERQLRCLARIDPVLCRRVADGLGLPVPQEDSRPMDHRDLDPSPALSQLGRSWPVDGRRIGILVDPSDEAGLAAAPSVAEQIRTAGALPVIIGPAGGRLPDGTPIARSLLTARSFEFDVLLVAGLPAPGGRTTPDPDSEADTGGIDPRARRLVEECYRQCKVVGAWGTAATGLREVLPLQAGVLLGEQPGPVAAEALELLGRHRAWERSGPGIVP